MTQHTHKWMYNHPVNTNTEEDRWRETFTQLCAGVSSCYPDKRSKTTRLPSSVAQSFPTIDFSRGGWLVCVWDGRCILFGRKGFLHELTACSDLHPPPNFTALAWRQASSVSPSWQVSYVCCLCMCSLSNVMWCLSPALSAFLLLHLVLAGTGWDMLNRH